MLVFMLIAISIMAVSVDIIISNSQSASSSRLSNEAYYAAEAGIENALVQLLRNPNYTGETLQIAAGSTAVITITGTGPFEVVSVGKSGSYIRTLQATINYTDSILTISSWKEIHP